MRLFVAIIMLLSFVLHTPGHSLAFNSDAVTVASASGQIDPSSETGLKGCHACTCTQAANPAIPSNLQTTFQWNAVQFILAGTACPASISGFPPHRPPRA